MTSDQAREPVHKSSRDFFVVFSATVSEWAGKPVTFALAVFGICIWGILGPILNYSESWQLVVNTATTIITFLMIFVLQNSQNRDAKALQVKLDELILTNARAENCFIGAESLGEADLLRLRKMLDDKLKAVSEGKDDVDPEVLKTLKESRGILSDIARSA